MENRSICRFPRLFPSSSFTICHFRHLSDVVESSILRTKITQNFQTDENKLYFSCSSSNKPQKAKNPKSDQKARIDVLKTKDCSPSNSSGWFSSEEHEVNGETDAFCGLSSPVSSASIRQKSSGDAFQEKPSSGRKPLTTSIPRKLTKTTTKRNVGNTNPRQKSPKTCRKNPKFHEELVKDASNDYYERRRKTCRSNQRRSCRDPPTSEVGWCLSIVVDGRVEESYAVEKSSSDPYSDFRLSMVEMIVEKQIFRGEDLGGLLHRFLSLNCPCHYKIIVEVFMEICDTLFNN